MAAPHLPARLMLDDAAATLASLRQALALEQGAQVCVAAGELKQFDSSAVAVLLELRRDLQAQGRTLTVSDWPPRLRDLVQVYGVESLLGA
ncbi:MAG: STAS domain-containing protein [Hydrogenophaga sp.]|uniref:STAS domain-containing protein n=1 Tax=Hydrogenophaga sp. TaxID=1904254 RepID=UPI001D9CDE03|nr:STAS domain-containing protein [Hydrogenophaga sp.]MBX3611748.1 STAS domain-containing protein [Hydrogenophaga sp.]